MPRVKRGVRPLCARHQKAMKAATGYYGARSRVYRVAVQAVTKVGQYAYRCTVAEKKRQFRLAVDLRSINAAVARQNGLSCSRLIDGLEEGFHRDRSQDPVRYRRSRRSWLSPPWLKRPKQLLSFNPVLFYR